MEPERRNRVNQIYVMPTLIHCQECALFVLFCFLNIDIQYRMSVFTSSGFSVGVLSSV